MRHDGLGGNGRWTIYGRQKRRIDLSSDFPKRVRYRVRTLIGIFLQHRMNEINQFTRELRIGAP